MLKKKLIDTLEPRPTVEDLDKLAEQIHQTSATAPTASRGMPSPVKKEAEPVESDQHRLTIDLPRWLVSAIKTEGKKNGITARGVILSILLEKFRE